MPALFVPTVRTHQDDIRDSTGSPVLKRVVEDNDVASLLLRVFDADEPVG
jgi:hypothetical protein